MSAPRKNKPVAIHTEDETTVTLTFNKVKHGSIINLLENPANSLRVLGLFCISALFDEIQGNSNVVPLGGIEDLNGIETLYCGLCDLVDIKLDEACAKIPKEKLF